ncbi:histidine kinase [Stylonychia lemnae]|uniref:Histidine kinase n=1 Tax=Stylonychia lemnae TaxID=5949 RepID=A0A078ABU4_STYLE|nr:histidine kinase [Stylonychia lemnae]|eukprot:CDW79062.1 histidine kinase [Stylonychia lemnae]
MEEDPIKFSQLIEERKQQTRNRKVAAQIMDSIEQLESEPTAVKRWVWELIQNAQDSAYKETNVRIKIELDSQHLRFYHTGRPFVLNDLLNLIEQGSNKERPQYNLTMQKTQTSLKSPQDMGGTTENPEEKEIISLKDMKVPETTGRFGTGFLTTYLLSKCLEVSGIFHFNEEGQYNFRNFKLNLNRDTYDLDKMIELNRQSFNLFKDLNDHTKSPILKDYKPGQDFDTCFAYELKEEGVKNAQEGLKSLVKAAPYVLSFKIKKNCIGTYEFVEKSIEVPNFFVDYPLIGSENLNFSVVFNSHLFYPNEKRSGISLEKGPKAMVNREIMQECQKLFDQFLDYVIKNKFTGMHCLRLQLDKNQVICNFLKDILIKPIIKKFVAQPIIESQVGFINLKQALFPNIEKASIETGDKDKLMQLWEILSKIYSSQGYLIKKDFDYIKSWIQVFEDPDWKIHLDQKNKININEAIAQVQIAKTIDGIKQQHGLTYTDVQDLMKKLYEYINQHYSSYQLKSLIQSYSIFVNQNGNLCKCEDLHLDNDIEEIYKDIVKGYGYNLRGKLLSKDFNVPFEKDFKNYFFYTLESEITDSIKSSLNYLKECKQNNKKSLGYKNKYSIAPVKRPTKLSLSYLSSIEELSFRILGLERRQVQVYNSLFTGQITQQQKEDEQRKQLIDLLSMTALHANIKIQVATNIPQTARDISMDVICFNIRRIILSCTNKIELISKLSIKSDIYEFLNSFYTIVKERCKPSSAKKLIDFQIFLNQNDKFFRFAKNLMQSQKQVTINQLEEDEKVGNKQGIKDILLIYLQLKDMTLNNLNEKIIHSSLSENAEKMMIGSNSKEYLKCKDICLEVDQILVKNCSQKDYLRKNEQLIMKFDRLYLSTFKEQHNQSLFPQYTKERKEIIVGLRQQGEMQEIMFEIYENEQQNLLKSLIKVSKHCYIQLDEIMKIFKDYNNPPDNLKDLIKYLKEKDINKVKITEMIQYLQTK